MYRFFQETIVVYQHTPHHELRGMTPHQKWLEGMQFGPPLVRPLTPAVEQLFWRMNPETRVITNKGVAAFGMHYGSPDLQGVSRVGWDKELLRYHFSYEPANISRIALFRDGKPVTLLEAKELRQADGSTMSISLWEQQLAKAIADELQANYQDRVNFVYVTTYAMSDYDGPEPYPQLLYDNWDLYPVAPYSRWLPKPTMTEFSLSLEAPVVLLIDSTGNRVYQGDEFSTIDEIEPDLQVLIGKQ